MYTMKIISLFLYIKIVYTYQHTTTIGRLHDIAEKVNTLSTTWTAHKMAGNLSKPINFFMGAVNSHPPASVTDDQSQINNQCEDNGLPKFFDAREQWPECLRVIDRIVDQSNCGSCWAASVSSAFTDRVCIKSKGKNQHYFSFQQLTSCCRKCLRQKNGCQGGWPIAAWFYIKRNGLVTGGDYDSDEGCQPYLLPNCEHHVEGSYPKCPSLPNYEAPKCKLHCYNKKYKKTFKEDRIKVDKYYYVDPCAAQNEIYKNGPIEALFATYEDFFTYKSGVYQYTEGKQVGFHSVRIIGWGEEKGVPYWLAANSWNKHWGEDGYFKIKRGYNEVWVETAMTAVSTVSPFIMCIILLPTRARLPTTHKLLNLCDTLVVMKFSKNRISSLNDNIKQRI